MKKALFIDRDGTLIREPSDFQVDCFEKLEFYPLVFQYLSRIASELDYELVLVTNQDGLGTAAFPELRFREVHNFITRTFRNEGIDFDAEFIDASLAANPSPNRKPGIGAMGHYLKGDYDLAKSFVIGDRITDVIFAKNLGVSAIWMNDGSGLGKRESDLTADQLQATIVLETTSWKAIYEFLKLGTRTAERRRSTRETDIFIRLNLDGRGKASVSTGIAFFDHMLEQIARHGNVDLEIIAKGDLHIDEHHTIEDTGICLGECMAVALGDKMGIERYGYSLPMDDCLARVALDFGGRSWLVWEAGFLREKIGDMPTEMFSHFFKSFADGAKCNIHIHAEGDNEHHKIEAIFKAFAKSIKMAVKRDPDHMVLPSTKGTM
jgi:imidazoleglycerol-phosphate dehydratase/histidinol-phosphatase